MIKLDGVEVKLSDRVVLSDVSFSLSAGELLIVRGGSGSGKTTLLNLMKGNVDFSGNVRVFGQRCAGSKDIRRLSNRMGFLNQQPVVMQGVSAIKHIQMSLWARGILHFDRVGKLTQAVLCRLGLMGIAHCSIDQLSVQERVRVAFAQCLVANPEVLFLDDPLFMNDPISFSSFMEVLESLLEEGRSVVWTSQHVPQLKRDYQMLRLVNGNYGY
ncbi:MAG TPA: ATP-binding cassette domain-containing protein [Gammaproteobacteria bacterium]|nr:ATP-binding cassette domain-containing protein [Gammaproteobacteria bacterium]